VRLRRLFLLYAVVFNGFVGYSLMIAVFTPLLVDGRAPLLSASASHSAWAQVLGVLLTLYPLGQFIGSPVLAGARRCSADCRTNSCGNTEDATEHATRGALSAIRAGRGVAGVASCCVVAHKRDRRAGLKCWRRRPPPPLHSRDSS
jgi:hypothetical protein